MRNGAASPPRWASVFLGRWWQKAPKNTVGRRGQKSYGFRSLNPYIVVPNPCPPGGVVSDSLALLRFASLPPPLPSPCDVKLTRSGGVTRGVRGGRRAPRIRQFLDGQGLVVSPEPSPSDSQTYVFTQGGVSSDEGRVEAGSQGMSVGASAAPPPTSSPSRLAPWLFCPNIMDNLRGMANLWGIRPHPNALAAVPRPPSAALAAARRAGLFGPSSPIRPGGSGGSSGGAALVCHACGCRASLRSPGVARSPSPAPARRRFSGTRSSRLAKQSV